MFNAPDPVRPGDLITAEQWNAMLALLDDLQARVETLEVSALRIEIEDVIAPSPLRTGDTVTVIGRNFKTTAGTARAFVDGMEVAIAPGTFTTSRLDFTLPVELTPPENGRLVVLRVSNGRTDDTRRLTVMPRVVPITGEVAIQWLGVEPATIRTGASIVWRYRAQSLANQDATFTVQAVVNPGGVVPSNAFEVLNSNRELITSKAITLQAGATLATQFFVRVASFPNLPAGTNFTLSLNFLLNGAIFSASDPEPFTVGQATTQPDNTISLTLAGVTPETALTPPNIIRPTTSQIEVEVAIDAFFTVAGKYRATVSQVTGFPVDRTSVPDADFEVSAEEIRTAPDNKFPREFPLIIGRPIPGTIEQDLVITVQRVGITQKQELTFILRPG